MGVSAVAEGLVAALFPQETYGNEVPEVLHYLIALDQSIDTIKGWIGQQTLSKLSHRAINQLSPLDLCALLGRKDIAKLLLAKNVSYTDPDMYGRTPFHYAYVVHGETSPIFQLFVQAAAKSHLTVGKILKGSSPTYLNIEKLLTFPAPAPTDFVFHYRKGKEIVQGTAEEFTQMTGGAIYSDRISATPENLLRNWLKNRTKEQSAQFLASQEAFKIAYKLFLQQAPPMLYLGKDEELSHIEKLGYDVYSNQNIEVGDIVCIYAGELKGAAHPSSTSRYHAGNTDAEKLGNLGRVINHGYPNVVIYTFYGVEGLSKIQVYVAIERIKSGDKLCMNYGPTHEIISMPYRVELRKTQLLHFFNRRHPADVYNDFNNKGNEQGRRAILFKHLIAGDSDGDRLRYVFQDPFAFKLLLEEKKSDKQYLSRLTVLLQDQDFRIMVGIESNILYHDNLARLCQKTKETGHVNQETFNLCVLRVIPQTIST